MDKMDIVLKQWNDVRPDLDVTGMGVIGRLKLVHQYMQAEMQKTWDKYDLNLASFDVLATLRRAGEPYQLSPGALIQSSLVTSGTMTNRVDRLVQKGLVERVKNPDDGRGFFIALTEPGFHLIEQAIVDHVETQNRLVSAIPDLERQQFSDALKVMMSQIDFD